MWTRTYLVLLAIRLYLALSPSYIHPDENFQGPEIVAGHIFSFPHHSTWEFTSPKPVRSAFALYLVYAPPLILLRWIWPGFSDHDVHPAVAYYTLRILMFLLSFVLEDWAIHELVQNPRNRRIAVTLVASSYVTWTYQTHTFSNAVEAIIVLWSLVMVQRIQRDKQRAALLSSTLLGMFLVFGVWNRATFPAFVLVPCLTLLPHFRHHPSSLLVLGGTICFTALVAISCDTAYYTASSGTPLSSSLLRRLIENPTIVPLNSLIYNTDRSNLARHGIHPYYLHLVVNLPLLLGPVLFLLPSLFTSSAISTESSLLALPTLSTISGLFILSLVPHQEARFLIPIIPAYLSSIRLPPSRTTTKVFITAWIAFNVLLGTIFGVFHQGGVVPVQVYIGQQAAMAQKQQHPNSYKNSRIEQVFWWRTYSPPIWLLDHANVTTHDMMGTPYVSLRKRIDEAISPCQTSLSSTSSTSSLGQDNQQYNSIGLVAPFSSLEIDPWRKDERGWKMEEVKRWNNHLNLDDLDFGGPRGVWNEIWRVVGRRGLVLWSVERDCLVEEVAEDEEADDDDGV